MLVRLLNEATSSLAHDEGWRLPPGDRSRCYSERAVANNFTGTGGGSTLAGLLLHIIVSNQDGLVGYPCGARARTRRARRRRVGDGCDAERGENVVKLSKSRPADGVSSSSSSQLAKPSIKGWAGSGGAGASGSEGGPGGWPKDLQLLQAQVV